MTALRWILIAISLVAGVFLPWKHQLVIMAVLLLGYACCHGLKWKRYQLVLAYLYGGLATGLGLQILIAYGMRNLPVQMIVVPLLVWLVLRIIFYGFETKYTLHPSAAVTQIRAEEYRDAVIVETKGTSAWASEASGQASVPDANGRYLRYDYFHRGEIAMGGPTCGDVVFNNGCAFSGVGPSVALSENGHYAAMTLPSREHWRLLIADLQEKRVYEPARAEGFWELDHFRDGVISGRCSPLTDNEPVTLTLSDVIAHAPAQAMVNDDGWWIMDYPGRETFKRYGAVSIASDGGTHRVVFVPDLKRIQANPFLRSEHPDYTVLVDDVLLDITAQTPHACWVNGRAHDKVSDGRFLVIQDCVLDFRDAGDTFTPATPRRLSLAPCDPLVSLAFVEFEDAGAGHLRARATIHPRSVGWNEAEYPVCSTTSPWDDEAVEYWNADGHQQTMQRTRIQRWVDYDIDLPAFSALNNIAAATIIHPVNRGDARHTAHLTPRRDAAGAIERGAYALTTRCGVTLEPVSHEAIWSHCGRYLAVVRYEPPPQVPHRIVIIDFAGVTCTELSGGYAVPSFIWFDADMLAFAHLIGRQECLRYGRGKKDLQRDLRISDPGYADNPHDLLMGDLQARRMTLAAIAAAEGTGDGYTDASVTLLAQHCILFAPGYDRPVLQPPPVDAA